MATNTYGKSCTPNLGGVAGDSYSKAEINSLLNAKANTSSVYNRSYLDEKFSLLDTAISSLLVSKIGPTDLQSGLDSLQSEIESNTSEIYATISETYSKTEVDNLISSLNLDPTTLLKKVPLTSEENTINPGSNDSVSLTIRGSSVNPIVTRWLNSEGDLIGYIDDSGVTTLEGKLSVGRLVSDGDIAIDVNSKRITNLSDPASIFDAISYKYLQTYVLDFYESILRPETPTFYSLDAGAY
jgi:hypothetical protein